MEYYCTCGSEAEWSDDHGLDCRLNENPEFCWNQLRWNVRTGTFEEVADVVDGEAGETVSDLSNDIQAALAKMEERDGQLSVLDQQAWGEVLSTKGKAVTAKTTVVKHAHYQVPVKLSDGTIIRASSQHDRKPGGNEPIPDLGVYLDGWWQPDCRAYLIGCPDMGVPVPNMNVVVNIASEALQCAREGKLVEVGCIGGHGRTGLFLAVVELMVQRSRGQQLDARGAIKLVRREHCSRAIETAKQEWYVGAVACWLNGEPIPAYVPVVVSKPAPPKVNTTAATASTKTGGGSSGGAGGGQQTRKNVKGAYRPKRNRA